MDGFSLSDLTMDEILVNKHKAGEEWVNACAIHQRYEKGLDESLRKIMKEMEKTPCPSYRKKWDKDTLRYAAQGSDAWTKYLDEMNVAYRTMLEAINERDTWRSVYEAKRSQLVNEREKP